MMAQPVVLLSSECGGGILCKLPPHKEMRTLARRLMVAPPRDGKAPTTSCRLLQTLPVRYSMRPKIKTKFLTVVWGQAYIERFAALALPSFLAPGNLPALADLTDLEVVVMTRAKDIKYFDTLAACRSLRAICPVRFIEIDDLISHGVYGVTLTLAYARPLIACGEDMLDTHFVFMNADFVLADGSLRSLVPHILDGRSIVLAPSFRAVAEAVEGRLEKLVDPVSGTLVIPPRELARLSLPHPHPTTIAKTRTQSVFHSSHPNQFFWPVNEQTLLGRYYLIFMLCLKPERVIDSINCYCDYSFVPEMCPSGDEVVMGDSDEFFMLELQDRDKETHMLRLGQQSERHVARSLQEWTTAEHRRAAQYDIVFHVGDLPPELDAVKAEARAFIDRIGRRLRRPVPHVDHFYWSGGVEVWKMHRAHYGLSTSPPELAPLPRHPMIPRAYRHVQRKFAVIRQSLAMTKRSAVRAIGRALMMTPFNPSWLDSRVLRETIGGMVARPGARALIVRDNPRFVDRLVRTGAPVRFASLREALSGKLLSHRYAGPGYTHVLVYLQRTNCRHTQRVVERCQALAPLAECQVFLHDPPGESRGGSFAHELTTQFNRIFGWPPRIASLSIVGGRYRRFNKRFLEYVHSQYARFGLWSLPWVLPVLAIAAPVVVAVNLYQRKKPSARRLDGFCSSVLVRLQPPDKAAAQQAVNSVSAGLQPYAGSDGRARVAGPSPTHVTTSPIREQASGQPG